MLPFGSNGKVERNEQSDSMALEGTGLIANFVTAEEKGSDVNLAVNLINGAWKGEFDATAVVSNDTDLVPAI